MNIFSSGNPFNPKVAIFGTILFLFGASQLIFGPFDWHRIWMGWN